MNRRQPARWLGMLGLCLGMLSMSACQLHLETAAEHQTSATEVGATTHATLTAVIPPTVEAAPAGPTPTEAPLALYPTPTAQPGQPSQKPTTAPTVVRASPASAVANGGTATPAPAKAPAVAHIAAKTPPTRIVSPAIHLDSTVKETTWQIVREGSQLFSEWIVPDYVAGWHSNSALPGAIGNTVMSGHHNIRGEVFRHLVELAEGDPIYLYADERWFAYRVESSFIVPERDASAEEQAQNALWIAPTTDERLTLVTCWPYTNNTHRLLIIAKPADDLAGTTPK